MAQYHTFTMYPNHHTFPGILVPQEVYRTQPVYQVRDTIRFNVNGRPGIKLTNALINNIAGLEGANTVPALTNAQRASFRINWPGYAPWSDTLHVVDGDQELRTLGKLAEIVARVVRRFFDDNRHVQSTEPSSDWWVNTRVAYESLYLVELRHVSQGSWQPVLCMAV